MFGSQFERVGEVKVKRVENFVVEVCCVKCCCVCWYRFSTRESRWFFLSCYHVKVSRMFKESLMDTLHRLSGFVSRFQGIFILDANIRSTLDGS